MRPDRSGGRTHVELTRLSIGESWFKDELNDCHLGLSGISQAAKRVAVEKGAYHRNPLPLYLRYSGDLGKMTGCAKYKESVEAPRTGRFMDKKSIECLACSLAKKHAHDGKNRGC
jgi:hypothetical protein